MIETLFAMLILTQTVATTVLPPPAIKVEINDSRYNWIREHLRNISSIRIAEPGEDAKYHLIVTITPEPVKTISVSAVLLPNMDPRYPEVGSCVEKDCEAAITKILDKILFTKETGIGYFVLSDCPDHDAGWDWVFLRLHRTADLVVESKPYYSLWNNNPLTRTHHYLKLYDSAGATVESGRFKPIGSTRVSARQALRDYCSCDAKDRKSYALLMQFTPPPLPRTRSQNATTAR